MLWDVVLTTDEISGLMSGLLASDRRPTGRMRLSEWLPANGANLGRRYASELERHFRDAQRAAGCRASAVGYTAVEEVPHAAHGSHP